MANANAVIIRKPKLYKIPTTSNLAHNSGLTQATYWLYDGKDMMQSRKFKDIEEINNTVKDVEYFMETVEKGYIRIASPQEIEERIAGVRSPIIICGHTHVPRLIKHNAGQIDEQMIFNPGSVGLPAYEDDHPHYHVIENGSPDARYAILERRNAQWQVDFHAVAYDFEIMAQLAQARERADWVRALRTGYMC